MYVPNLILFIWSCSIVRELRVVAGPCNGVKPAFELPYRVGLLDVFLRNGATFKHEVCSLRCDRFCRAAHVLVLCRCPSETTLLRT